VERLDSLLKTGKKELVCARERGRIYRAGRPRLG
jgi:hypothetical protein